MVIQSPSEMNTTIRQKPLISTKKQQQHALPVIVIGVSINILLLVYSILRGMSIAENQIGLALAVVMGLFFLTFYFIIIPFTNQHPNLRWIVICLNFSAVLALEFLDPFLPAGYLVLFNLSLLMMLTILYGRWTAYTFVGFGILASIVIRPLSLGEQSDKIFQNLLTFPLLSVLIVETIIRLQDTLMVELRRMQILNQVSRSLSSSLEMHQVLALVSSAIQNALDADTYYVGLLRGQSIHLELFYDDGEFFPSMDVPLEGTLAGRVINSRKSVLIHNLPEDRKKLNINFTLVGKPKVSRSWMGTVLESGGVLLGLVAVASYTKNAFNDGDLELLENIAQQAGLALENAQHHLEVENRSRLDSLTSALNHNAFLARLHEVSLDSETAGNTLSLIMLDIDYFKQYNDSYGHLIGDQVLVQMTQVIQRNIKQNDIVGRWGGEEFAIGLPNTHIQQACLVAERIQRTLENLTIPDRDHKNIKSPTVSQGIASFPDEVDCIEHLIDLADQRLYIAKERGRNQIEAYAQPTLDREPADPTHY